MNTNNTFKVLFFSSVAITLTGALLKIMHLEYAQPLLIIGILLTLGYIVFGITEVINSKNIDKSEKIMWIVGFIFFGFITSIVYLVSGRKRVLKQ